MTKILYLGPEQALAAAQAGAGDRYTVVPVETTAEALRDALSDASAIIDASMRVKITRDLLEAAPALRVISCATTGSDHIDKGALGQRGLLTLRDAPEILANLTPAAELSWALVLACARGLPAAVDHVRAGKWVREDFPGMMLRGRQLGLIGCGRIGGWMARYADAFDMTVVGYDPFNPPKPPIRAVALDEVVATSDVISVHVHLSPETTNLISQRHFQTMKPGAIFINTSRSGVADEAGLLEALTSGRLHAAGLDVLGGEPDIGDNPLLAYAQNHSNLLITPHCGGFSPDAVAVVVRHASAAAVRYLEARR